MTDHGVDCVDCQTRMTLEPPRELGGPFYLCRLCHGTLMAHADGRPRGWMGDRETRAARDRAHRAVDPLWHRYGMSRTSVYRWVAAVLGIDRSAAHFAQMTREQCERVIARVENLLWKLGGH